MKIEPLIFTFIIPQKLLLHNNIISMHVESNYEMEGKMSIFIFIYKFLRFLKEGKFFVEEGGLYFK